MLCDGYGCSCGAIALGAPPHDFDEIDDTAASYFERSAASGQAGVAGPEHWKTRYGVESAAGGRRAVAPGREYAYQWYRRMPNGRL